MFWFYCYVCKILPLFNLKILELENEFWQLLQIGIGGYVVGRTGKNDEKLS